jgi:hypothetical protein
MNKEDDLILNFITGLYRWVNAKLDDETLLELEEKIKKGGFEKEDLEKYKQDFLSREDINKFNISPQSIFRGIKNCKSRRNLKEPESLPSATPEQREKQRKKLNQLKLDALKKEKNEEVEKEESLYIYEFYDSATEKFSYGCKGKIKFEDFEKACSKQYHINKSSFPKVYAVKYIKRRGVTWTHSI